MNTPTTKHYHYGSGEHGCLYDNGPHYAETYKDAVESLAFTFELGRTRFGVGVDDYDAALKAKQAFEGKEIPE